MSLFTLFITLFLLHLPANGAHHFLTTPTYTLKELGLEEHLNQLLQEKRVHNRRLATLSLDHKRDLLDIHNDGRSQTATGGATGHPKAKNMNRLVWDDGLAATAAQYAEVCVWGHSTSSWKNTAYSNWQAANPGQGISGPSTGWVGENLYISSSQGLSDTALIANLLSGVQAWYDEWVFYDFDTQVCTPGEQCGHYTQMVWATTTHIGCGWHECTGSIPGLPNESWWTDGATYLVCHYYQGGNVGSQYEYLVANSDSEICSQCDSSMNGHCHNGLCTDCTQTNCPDGLGRVTFRPTLSPTLPTPSPTNQPTRGDDRIVLSGFENYNFGSPIGVLDLNGVWTVYDPDNNGNIIYKHPSRDFVLRYVPGNVQWYVVTLAQAYANSWSYYTICGATDILTCNEGSWTNQNHPSGTVSAFTPATPDPTQNPVAVTPDPTQNPVTPDPTGHPIVITPDPTPDTPSPVASTPEPTSHPVESSSGTCTYTAANTQYRGTRISRTVQSNIDACCQECHGNASCVGFRYHNNGNCDILSNISNERSRTGWQSGTPN